MFFSWRSKEKRRKSKNHSITCHFLVPLIWKYNLLLLTRNLCTYVCVFVCVRARVTQDSLICLWTPWFSKQTYTFRRMSFGKPNINNHLCTNIKTYKYNVRDACSHFTFFFFFPVLVAIMDERNVLYNWSSVMDNIVRPRPIRCIRIRTNPSIVNGARLYPSVYPVTCLICIRRRYKETRGNARATVDWFSW